MIAQNQSTVCIIIIIIVIIIIIIIIIIIVVVLQMISPGYYSQECNAHKRCKDPTKYCHMFLCVDCLKENVACTQNGQCCPGSECIYGRCKSGAAAGQAGKRRMAA